MEILSSVDLAPRTTARIGGQARHFIEPLTRADVCKAVSWALANNLPLLTIGRGSNLIVSDYGWPGLVLYTASRYVRTIGQWPAASGR